MVHEPATKQAGVMNSTSLEDVALSEHSDQRAQSINSLHTDDLRSTTPTSTRNTTPTPENNPSFEELQERLDRSERQITNIQNQRDHLLRLTDGFKQQLSLLERERSNAASEKEQRSKEIDDGTFDMSEVAALEERMNQLNELIGAQKKLELGLDAGLGLTGSSAKNATDPTFGAEMAEEWRTVRHLLDDIFIARSNCKRQFDAILSEPSEQQSEPTTARQVVTEPLEQAKTARRLDIVMPDVTDKKRMSSIEKLQHSETQPSNPYKEALVRQLKALTGEVSKQNVTVEDALNRISALQADISQRQEQTAAAIQMGTDALLRHTLTPSPRPRSVRDSNESSTSPERKATKSNNVTSSEFPVRNKTIIEPEAQDSAAIANKKHAEDAKNAQNRIIQTDILKVPAALRLNSGGLANKEISDYPTSSCAEVQPVYQHVMQIPLCKKASPTTQTQNGKNLRRDFDQQLLRNTTALTAETAYRLSNISATETVSDPRVLEQLLKAQQRIICNISRFNEIMNIQRHEVDNLNDSIRTLNDVLRQSNLPNLTLPQVRSDCLARSHTTAQVANTLDCMINSCNMHDMNGMQRAQSEQPVQYLHAAPMTYMLPINNFPVQNAMLQQRFNNNNNNNNNSDTVYNSMERSDQHIANNNAMYGALSNNALLLQHLPQQQVQAASAAGNATGFHYNNEAWESQAPLNVGAPPVFMHHHNNLIHQHNANLRAQNQQIHLPNQQLHPLV